MYTQKSLSALLMAMAFCVIACSDAAPDNNNPDPPAPAATPSASSPSMTPSPVEDPHPGEVKRDHVEVKKGDSTAQSMMNTAPKADTLQTGTGIRRER